jgi:hypothetical protein
MIHHLYAIKPRVVGDPAVGLNDGVDAQKDEEKSPGIFCERSEGSLHFGDPIRGVLNGHATQGVKETGAGNADSSENIVQKSE